MIQDSYKYRVIHLNGVNFGSIHGKIAGFEKFTNLQKFDEKKSKPRVSALTFTTAVQDLSSQLSGLQIDVYISAP